MAVLKKGIFFTLSGFLLVALVVSVSIFVAVSVRQSSERLTEAAGLDRTFTLERSVEAAITAINNDIIVTISNASINATSINFTEPINGTFANYRSDFYTSLTTLKDYLETDQEGLNITPEIIYDTEKIPIVISPYDLRYTHINDGGDIELQITSNYIVESYQIDLILPQESINPGSDIQWMTQNGGTDIELQISATDNVGYTATFSNNLSATDVNRFSIAGCSLDFNDLGASSVELNCNNAVRSSIVAKPQLIGQQVSAHYPAGLLIINLSNLGIYKNRSMRIA